LNTEENYIVFFDGVCNLCNTTVNFILQHNAKSNLKFSSLQSPFAKQFLSKFNIASTELSTIYFFENGQLFQKSDAVLGVAKHLATPYHWLYYFSFLPTGFRNLFYNFIARNRYRFFGQSKTCRLATIEEQTRFLED